MKKGFTLIEVLVVAVIVAILAAVAIPSYTHYIQASYHDVCENTAASVASMMSSRLARSEVQATAQTAISAEMDLPANYALTWVGSDAVVTFDDGRYVTSASVRFD